MIETITPRQFEIIEAAGKILTKAGVGGLTIKNLAKEMQFSESAIYRHFPSKESIIIAMLCFLADDMDKRYANIINEAHSIEEKFIVLFQNLLSFFHSNPHFVVAVFSDGLIDESHAINYSITNILKVKIKHLKPIIQDGQNNGIFINSLSTDDLVHIVMGAMRLQMYKWRMANFEFNIIEFGNRLILSLLVLIKTK
ncbi:TetR/AcrR family fatty acid metabolism transcriptional regulator [Pedobacter sp. UYEF25]